MGMGLVPSDKGLHNYGVEKQRLKAVIRRCAAFANAHMESAGSRKLEAGSLADGGWFFLSFEPQAFCPKLLSALADGLMLAVP